MLARGPGRQQLGVGDLQDMRRFLVLAGLSVVAPGAGASAKEAWRAQVAPCLRGPGLEGDVQPGRAAPAVEVDRSLFDVLDDLDGAPFVNATARRGRLVLFGDFTWASLSEEKALSVPGLPGAASAQARVAPTMFTLAAGYSVLAGEEMALDLLGGIRAWRVETELRVPAVGLEVSRTESWLDPILGTRARWQLTPDLSLIGYADVGAFGAGSELTWQAVATVNY